MTADRRSLFDVSWRAIGKVLNLGGRVGTAEGRLLDAAGKLYAHATTTCLILGER